MRNWFDPSLIQRLAVAMKPGDSLVSTISMPKGLVLKPQLAHINRSFPSAHFGEDEQTAYGDAWTGAKVVFAGHRAIDQAAGIARAGTGPYEHPWLPLS